MRIKNPRRAAGKGYTSKQQAAVMAAVEHLSRAKGAGPEITLKAICEQAAKTARCEMGHVEQILRDEGHEVLS